MSITNITLPPLTIDDLKSELSNITTSTTFSSVGGIDTIDLGSLSTISVTGSPQYTIGASGSNTVWTTTGTGTSFNWSTPQPATTIGQDGRMSLRGENADLDINGKSMKAWMEKVEERLNILTPNPELEKEWDDLRKLGEKYRKLEKKCKEKAEVWKKLKQMPPPTLD